MLALAPEETAAASMDLMLLTGNTAWHMGQTANDKQTSRAISATMSAYLTSAATHANNTYIAVSKFFLPSIASSTELNIMFHNENRDGDYAMFCLEVDGMTQEEDMVALVKKYLKPLTICYNMGWQHHSLGSAYNSMSGHAFLIGANSNKILKQIVFSESCCTCTRREWKDPESAVTLRAAEPMGVLPTTGKDHRCPRNFKGSSKLMELQGAIALLTDLFNSGIVFVAELVVDDNCSTQANACHSFKKIDEKIWAIKKFAGQEGTEIMSSIMASYPSECLKSNIFG